MSHTNIEIKARTNQSSRIRKFLLEQGADFRGTDLQTDTYFNVPAGRLKLRQGNIENSLIYYERQNVSGPKQSDFELVPVGNGDQLKSVLTRALGTRVIVVKRREIYYIKNVKFHLDLLDGLGEFVEIEATNIGYDVSVDELRQQCNYYMRSFDIAEHELLAVSYSDMLIEIS